jgi:hypothetical protein
MRSITVEALIKSNEDYVIILLLDKKRAAKVRSLGGWSPDPKTPRLQDLSAGICLAL